MAQRGLLIKLVLHHSYMSELNFKPRFCCNDLPKVNLASFYLFIYFKQMYFKLLNEIKLAGHFTLS